MIKKIFTAVTVSAFIFSCNNAGDKTNLKKENRVIVNENQEKNKDLIYLDTAENIYNILCQDWVMEDDAGSLEGMTESSQMEIPYRSLCFSANGTFFKNPRNSFDYGTWQYDDATKTITINNSIEKGKDVYKIAKIAYDEMTLVNTGIGSITNLKFIAPGKRYKNANDEPYSLQNNRWRIKPTSKESDSAIHQRLKENLYFFILFYKSALAKEDKAVSFWGLPSCFKWYGGAIFIKKKDELKDNWINCFYNKDQAMQAYALADKLLSQKYNWPKGEQNWLKLNLAVVELMYKKLDEVR
ncbi:MAG: hypothetical protein IPI88_06950 [Chitinophagaceae bacterium]|nr:hypothetical protein [Chitinophagaceae bacterium]